MSKNTQQEMEDMIDVYGSEIVRLTMKFIKGEITEEDRNEQYAIAGYKHLKSIKSELTRQKEELSLNLKHIRKVSTFEESLYQEGYYRALDDILTLLK